MFRALVLVLLPASVRAEPSLFDSLERFATDRTGVVNNSSHGRELRGWIGHWLTPKSGLRRFNGECVVGSQSIMDFDDAGGGDRVVIASSPYRPFCHFNCCALRDLVSNIAKYDASVVLQISHFFSSFLFR